MDYKPQEKTKKIGKRLLKLIIENDRNYKLTYQFMFNLFDVNADNRVSKSEILEIFKTFGVPSENLKKVEQNLNKVFDFLK